MLEHPTIKALRKIKICHEGFNMSIIEHPDHPRDYLATIRDKFNTSYEYPSIENIVYLVHLDSTFQVIHSKKLEDPLRKRHESFTTGFEDCRLIDGNMMTGVLLDNTDQWVPEMCLCNFDRTTYKIDKMIVFNTDIGDGGEKKPEKNWLVLNRNTTKLFMLYSYDPLRVMSVDIETGDSRLIHFQKIFNLENCQVHGGGVVYIEKERKYLVNVRVVNDNKYQFSLWLLLNQQYKLTGMSEGFLFSNNESSNTPNYEMCMSLIEKNDFIYASVSINDSEIFIYEFSLDDLLKNSIFPC